MARLVHVSAGIVVLLALAGLSAAQAPTPTGAACATDGSSANIAFSTSGTNRVITTNFCPNHPIRTINPNAARVNRQFGVTNQQYTLPLQPYLAPTAQIINLTCQGGPVGFARSGATIFSVHPGTCGGDAVKLEGVSFDECGGHSEGQGLYHYHLTPSCTLTSAGATSGQHSPILGYMVDGIPLYGPLGASGVVPTDLDSCGGHSSDGGNNGNYHYHMKPIKGTWPDPATPLTTTTGVGAGWPYTPGCLRGCVPEPYLAELRRVASTVPQTTHAACTSAGTIQPQAESISTTATTTTTVAGATTTSPIGAPSASWSQSATVAVAASIAGCVFAVLH